MVLHWRRCGRAGGCQEQKRKRQIRCREKFIIDTGKDEQQLITANPYSRAVLFMITLVLPVIRGLNESSGFWWLIKHQSEKQNILKLMEASFQRIKYLFCNVPWKPHIRNRKDQNILIKTSEVIVITGNCVMVTHFEENKAKKLAEDQRV